MSSSRSSCTTKSCPSTPPPSHNQRAIAGSYRQSPSCSPRGLHSSHAHHQILIYLGFALSPSPPFPLGLLRACLNRRAPSPSLRDFYAHPTRDLHAPHPHAHIFHIHTHLHLLFFSSRRLCCLSRRASTVYPPFHPRRVCFASIAIIFRPRIAQTVHLCTTRQCRKPLNLLCAV